MCLQKEEGRKEDISFGDVYRLLPTTHGGCGTPQTHEYMKLPEGNTARLSASDRACIQ